MDKVRITGIGCITGSGNTAAQTLKTMFENTAMPAPFSRHTMDWGKEALVFEVAPSFRSTHWGSLKQYSITSRFGLGATYQALEDAGLSVQDIQHLRVGVVMGTTVGCSMNSIPFYESFRNYTAEKALQEADNCDVESTSNEQRVTGEVSLPSMEPIRRFLRSNPSEVINRELGISGPTQSIVTACASGTDAIGIGAQWIENDLCDIVIAGGCDALTRVTLNGFNSLMIVADERCRPFDANRKGLNLGEGAGVVILESAKFSAQRNATPKALVEGYATACDAHHLTAPHPEGRGLIRAIEQLFSRSEYSYNDVAFVNVHGTGTKDNDAVESHVMHTLMPNVPFFSSKGATGHTLGAAGGVEATLCVECLQSATIPPTTGLCTPDPANPASPVMRTTHTQGTLALSTSLAFGGLASVLALSRPQCK